ncbi:MAG: twin-arginine translocation signal domain-containing protein [Desulfovibrio sp.]|nr:twin-arginine translocation signal domain-containing protein [Desulfovibrio sp.]
MRKWTRRMFLGALASAGAGGLLFLNSERFGALPEGDDL